MLFSNHVDLFHMPKITINNWLLPETETLSRDSHLTVEIVHLKLDSFNEHVTVDKATAMFYILLWLLVGLWCITWEGEKSSTTTTTATVMVMKLNSVTKRLFTMKIRNCYRCTKVVQFQCLKEFHLSLWNCCSIFLSLCLYFLLSLKMEISMLTGLYIIQSIECLHSTRCNWCCVYFNFTASIHTKGMRQQKKKFARDNNKKTSVFPEKILYDVANETTISLLFLMLKNKNI